MGKRPLAIDLFAGCGGMSLGLEAAGFDIVGAVEIDPIHALVHHFNFPYGVTVCQDITQLSSADLMSQIKNKGFHEDIDLIAGGPPCQGFSMIGKRNVQDPRNQLVFEYLRIVKEIKPKYFIFENVAGIAAGEHKQFLRDLIEQFEAIGYQITKPAKILDASLYGLPQKRKRLFLLGSRNDVAPIDYPQEINQSDSKIASFMTVGDVICDLSNIPAYQGIDRGIAVSELNYSGFRKHFSVKNSGDFSLCHRRVNSSKIWGHLGSKHTPVSIKRFQNTPHGKTEKISRFLKLDPLGLSNTLRAGTPSSRGAHTAPRPIHYQEPRCITVREAARLHTFPDWFQFHRTIWHGFREIGNAVIPLLAKQIGDEIIQKLEINQQELPIDKLKKVDEFLLSHNMSEACRYWAVSQDVIPKRTRELITSNV